MGYVYVTGTAKDGSKITRKITIHQAGADPERKDVFIPELPRKEILDKLKKHMPIYEDDGSTTSFKGGTYLMKPRVVAYSTEGGTGRQDEARCFQFVGRYAMFYDIDADGQPSESNEGLDIKFYYNCSGNDFTLGWTQITSDFDEPSSLVKIAYVVSGTKTSGGIANMHYAEVILESTNDVNGVYPPEGSITIWKDDDGLSNSTIWDPGD